MSTEQSDLDYWRTTAQQLHQELESTKVLVEKAESSAEAWENTSRQLEATIKELTGEIRRLSVEVNSARSAAATAVQDYISNQE